MKNDLLLPRMCDYASHNARSCSILYTSSGKQARLLFLKALVLFREAGIQVDAMHVFPSLQLHLFNQAMLDIRVIDGSRP